VEGHLQGTGCRHHRTAQRLVDVAIGGQRTDHDAVRPQRAAVADVVEHRVHFPPAVQEVAGTGTHQDEQGQAYPVAGHRQRAMRGRHAATGEIGEQLHPVGTAGLRCKRRADAVAGDFQQPAHAQACPLA
jgi:hypothetical protein